MSLEGVISSLGLLLTALGMAFVVRGRLLGLPRDFVVLSLLLLSALCFHSLSNTLEWAFELPQLDTAEDFASVLVAALWGLAIHSWLVTRTAAEARDRQHKLEALFESSPDGILVARGDGSAFVDCNRRICDMLGYTRDELLELAVRDIHPLKQMDQVLRGFATQQQGERLVMRDLPVLRKDGSVFVADIGAAPMVLDDEPHQIGIFRDTTDRYEAERERYKLEQMLQQSQRLETVGRLAGGVAHDFNNMLQAIQGCLHLAKRRLPDESPVRRDLDHATEAADRAAGVTRQLLAFARRQVLQRQTFELSALTNDLMAMLARLIGEKIELVVEQRDESTGVLADRAQIEQVVVNICLNARDAMPTGGRLLIRTGQRQLDEPPSHAGSDFRTGRYTSVVIEDNGTGIDEATRARIFEPFFTTKEVGRGTGLGLSSALGIARQHGGWLTVNSEPGHGTRVELLLPTHQVKPAQRASSRNPPPAGGNETILLAEDEELVRSFSRVALEQAGYRVVEAADGDEAWTRWLEQGDQIELALLDVVMPGRGGIELLHQLRAARPTLPAVLISGYSQQADDPSAGLGTHTLFLPKPYKLDHLLRTLRELLDAR